MTCVVTFPTLCYFNFCLNYELVSYFNFKMVINRKEIKIS